MKATIEIPDELYRKLAARSAEQGRPIEAVTVELLQRGLGDSAASSLGGSEPPPLSHQDTTPVWPERAFRRAAEAFKHAPPGLSAREILEQDRGRLD